MNIYTKSYRPIVYLLSKSNDDTCSNTIITKFKKKKSFLVYCNEQSEFLMRSVRIENSCWKSAWNRNIKKSLKYFYITYKAYSDTVIPGLK